MEAKAELSSEVDTEQEEEKVIELGEASQETKGGPAGPAFEWPAGFGWP